MKRITFIILISVLLCRGIMAQEMWNDLASSDYRIDTAEVKALRVEIDNLSFFHDNEYTGKLMNGYSLPGLWVQPKLTFNPVRQIGLEVGLHALIFSGANKYPCYAYHDIARWKGNQYQSGAHLLPWFRARAQFKYLTVVLGDIYGGQNHRLVEPLLNPEVNLSQDPEMGVQLLWDRPHLHADIWLNWQSYIFETDTHQEAFTVGMNWTVSYNRPESRLKWFTPFQLVIQHRGGEQNIAMRGVQTICNAGAGVRMLYRTDRKALRNINTELNMLAAYQQKGELWPFKTGFSGHVGMNLDFWNQMDVKAGYVFSPKHFISLYGNPLFNTVSQKDGTSYNGNHTLYAGISYHRIIARHYVIGAQAQAYQTWLPGAQNMAFDFGLYLRVNPSILIRKW
ncbi:MAG: hypothetical protein IKH05_05975 [Bacteroidaceae bacterium]|nr:hypothetical protein [Bacteroidaceae bacterium]